MDAFLARYALCALVMFNFNHGWRSRSGLIPKRRRRPRNDKRGKQNDERDVHR